MACGCNNVTIVDPGPSCKDCLKLVSLIVGCDTGPTPCGSEGGTFIKDLADYNDVTACDSGVYSIVDYETPGIASATITDEGVITIVTGDYYEYNRLWAVRYKYSCDNDIKSGTGTIYICFHNPCESGCLPLGSCHPCTGTCIVAHDLTMEENDSGSVDNCAGNVASISVNSLTNIDSQCTGDPIYEVTESSSAFTNVSISDVGLLSYETTNGALPNRTYPIEVKITCSEFGIDVTLTVNVWINDSCTGVECSEGDICRCSECISPDVDLSLEIN